MYEGAGPCVCIAEGRGASEEKEEARRVTPEHRHFKSAAEMRALFAICPRPVDNTSWSPALRPHSATAQSRSCRPFA